MSWPVFYCVVLCFLCSVFCAFVLWVLQCWVLSNVFFCLVFFFILPCVLFLVFYFPVLTVDELSTVFCVRCAVLCVLRVLSTVCLLCSCLVYCVSTVFLSYLLLCSCVLYSVYCVVFCVLPTVLLFCVLLYVPLYSTVLYRAVVLCPALLCCFALPCVGWASLCSRHLVPSAGLFPVLACSLDPC